MVFKLYFSYEASLEELDLREIKKTKIMIIKHTILAFIFFLSLKATSQKITIRSDKLADQAKAEITAAGSSFNASVQARVTGGSMSNLEAIETVYGTKKEGISFGLSLGFNALLTDHKNALISPVDNELIITNNQSTSFIISSIISFPISFKDRDSSSFRRDTDKNGQQIGKAYIDSNWSIIAVVNIAQFNNAISNTIFNQKISGGLGVSYSFTPTLSIGTSLELNSVIQPRDFLTDLNGQEIIVDNEVVKSLDSSDNSFFKEEYLPSLAIKLIYKII